MKKVFLFLAALGLAGSSYAQVTVPTPQLTDEEYAYVTMDLQGILNLTMTTDPNVNFSFKTITDYRNGITKFNATKLDVDATVAWDLYAYASSNYWEKVDEYSHNGNPNLPAEILQMKVVGANVNDPAQSFNNFTSLRGPDNAHLTALNSYLPVDDETQFIAGASNLGATPGSYDPGSAAANPTTNQFRVHYRMVPGIPAKFTTGTSYNYGQVDLAPEGYARAGYYYLEVVYALVEDL